MALTQHHMKIKIGERRRNVMSDKGLFGGLFDFNGDGKLDSFEKAAEFGMFMQMIDSQKNDELTAAGLNPEDLEDMGYFERREALEEAGLDPDDYE